MSYLRGNKDGPKLTTTPLAHAKGRKKEILKCYAKLDQ
jgi:hypothetical protein